MLWYHGPTLSHRPGWISWAWHFPRCPISYFLPKPWVIRIIIGRCHIHTDIKYSLYNLHQFLFLYSLPRTCLMIDFAFEINATLLEMVYYLYFLLLVILILCFADEPSIFLIGSLPFLSSLEKCLLRPTNFLKFHCFSLSCKNSMYLFYLGFSSRS